MKKISLSLILISFVLLANLALAETSNTTATTSNKAAKLNQTIDLPCVQTAVEKREAAIITAHDQLSSAIKTALETRKTALVQAWGITDRLARNKARKDAWVNYLKARKVAKSQHNTAVKTAWKQFHTDTKACKIATQGVEPEANDTQRVE